MLGALGDLLLKLSTGIYFYSLFALIIGLKSNDIRFLISTRFATYAGFILLLFSTICLVIAFVTHDYSIQYVADHSSNSMPMVYTWIAFYAGNEGSLLFICFSLSTLLFLFLRNQNIDDKTINFSSIFILLFMVFLLGTTSFLANPFDLAPYPPDDGQGINPLLLHFGMFIHPPVQMIGLTGVVIPFGISLGVVICKDMDAKLDLLRRWSISIWMVLTAGLALGSWWAYTILGWGGYWAWDPVENSSLMPWLIMTALIHSLIVQRKRNMFKGWNIFLVIFAFFMAQMGMFINRGGAVPSVHSFASSSLGWTFLIFMTCSSLFAFLFFIYYFPRLSSPKKVNSFLSRESFILIQNVLFLSVALITLMGTIYPVFTQSIENQEIYVGREFYDTVNGPILLALMIVLSIAPFIPWKNTSITNYIRKKMIFILIGILAALINSWYLNGHYWVTLTLFIFYFAISQFIYELYRIIALPRNKNNSFKNKIKIISKILASNSSRYGGLISHTGILLVMLGIAGTSFMGIERDYALEPGQSAKFKNYEFKYIESVITTKTDHTNYKAFMEIKKNDQNLGTYFTSKSYYPRFDMNSTKAGIIEFGLEDFYFSQSVLSEDNSAVFEIKINPLVSLIWYGAIIVVLGAFISILPYFDKSYNKNNSGDKKW